MGNWILKKVGGFLVGGWVFGGWWFLIRRLGMLELVNRVEWWLCGFESVVCKELLRSGS